MNISLILYHSMFITRSKLKQKLSIILYKRDTVYERIFIKKITCESSLLKWDIGCGFIVPKNCSKGIISLKKSIRFQADVMKICWQVLPIL